MGPRTARQHAADTAIDFEGLEANFWTAVLYDSSFLFLSGRGGPVAAFQLLATTAPWLQVCLAPYVPHMQDTEAPAPQAQILESDSSVNTSSQPPVPYDLNGWSDDRRQALVTELVDKGIAHGWTGATLNVSPDAKATVDAMTSQVPPPPSPPEPAVPVTSTTGNEPAGGLTQMSDRLDVLERLIAARDAGGLTLEEFDAARIKVARELVNGDE